MDGANIVGGALNGLPPMYEELLEGIDIEHYITLEPQYTGVTWKSIADTRDSCGIGLSIGVGLGALLSILAPETIPSALLALMPFIDVNVRGYLRIELGGGVYNDGSEATEMYIGVSEINYKTGYCYYELPVYYIEFRDQ